MMKLNHAVLLAVVVVLLSSSWAPAFEKAGCGAGDCRDCHAITKKEVADLLKGKVNEVLDVKRSDVPGLWDVEAVLDGQKMPLYMDFSKKYLISGNVIKLDNDENLTERKFVRMNRIDVAKVPLEDAVVIGNPAAARRIVVFDDPECSYCRKLHPEMEALVASQPDIAFFVKMFPLPSHPNAKVKAKAIVCAKAKGDNGRAAGLLADALAGKDIPAPECEGDQVERNIALAKELYIATTPTLIMPDGRVLPGYKPASAIVAALEEKQEEL